MRWFIFRRGDVARIILSVVVAGCTIAGVYAENTEQRRWEERHERKLERYQQGWARLIPQYEKIQYAGSMGLISLGIGWDYGKKAQWETDLFLGYLPRFEGDKGHLTITLKENYIPWCIGIKKERWKFDPFTVSLYMNKIFGNEFWTREPDKYPDGYYGVATNFRFNLAFGQRIHFSVKPVGLSERITLFYELGTNDLYIISYATNKYLHFSDIFNLSLGIKFQFL